MSPWLTAANARSRVIRSLRRIVVRLVSARAGTLADPDSSLPLSRASTATCRFPAVMVHTYAGSSPTCDPAGRRAIRQSKRVSLLRMTRLPWCTTQETVKDSMSFRSEEAPDAAGIRPWFEPTRGSAATGRTADLYAKMSLKLYLGLFGSIRIAAICSTPTPHYPSTCTTSRPSRVAVRFRSRAQCPRPSAT